MTNRFAATRMANDDGTWTTDWFVLDRAADDNPYIGPMTEFWALGEAARWNAEPFKAPTNFANDWTI